MPASTWAVPGYTELRPLGSGGFGTVVLATHDGTGTPVAIKYLRPGEPGEPDVTLMFRAEAAVLGSLDDPYVVRLFEYVESTAGAAIVMELVDGVTLRDILARQGKTTPEAALVVLFGSLLGLAAAHARGVVHRDYKPANVLVNSSGASKLTDFGIAARAGTPGIPAASRNYAPPEQYDGSPASPAGDVYAATATFYECLTGHPPFTGQTDEALMEQHRSAEVPMAAVPTPLQPLVARGMAKNPRYRPADAAALAAELRTAATGAYGQDWAERGRAQLGKAALLLAALWPSAGVPALQGTATAHVRLTQAAKHPRHPSLSRAERAARHRWHVLHLDHLRHLKYLRHLRAAAAATAAAAVVAAGVTVAVTGRSQSSTSPGAAGHPAVAAYPVALKSSDSIVPGDYSINRQISNVSPWILTLTDIRVLASGQAEFLVDYVNTGSTTAQLECSSGKSDATLTLSNGQTIRATADFCSQRSNPAPFNVGAGQSSLSYAIFPNAGRLAQPFSFTWPAGNLSGKLDGLKLPVSTGPTSGPTSPVVTSPASFSLHWPSDMTLACVSEYGQGTYAEFVPASPPSYSGACTNGTANLGGIDLSRFCPQLAQRDHYTSPNGPNGWWAGNPERFDSNTSDQPWRDWRCYNHNNTP